MRLDIHMFLGKRFESFCTNCIRENRECLPSVIGGLVLDEDIHEIDVVSQMLGETRMPFLGECIFETTGMRGGG